MTTLMMMMAGQVDEVEVFKGSENSLRMMQTYTHRFQCSFVLTQYPFDTQAIIFGSYRSPLGSF